MNEINHITYKTFDDIVNHVMSEKELDQRAYARILKLVQRGWNVMFREIMPNVITVTKTMTNLELKFLDFPEDMDDWCKVGIKVKRLDGTNQVLTLSRNERIYIPTPEEILAATCNCITNNTTETISAIFSGSLPVDYYIRFNNVVRGNQYVGELYGAGGGESCYGSFRVDYENMRFVFSSDIPSDLPIVLEYKPNGSFKGRFTRIHDKATEALIAYAEWKMLHEKNSSGSDRASAERRYYDEFKNLKSIIDPPTMDELLDILYESASLTF